MTEFINYVANHFGIFLLIFARISSLLLFFPFISANFIPANVKILLIVSITFLCIPYVNTNLDINQLKLLQFFLLVVKELLTGFFLALVSYVFYGIVIYAAELISYVMGLTVANMFDPTFGMVSVLGRFFIVLFFAVFFTTGAYQVFFATLFESFRALPVGSFTLNQPLFEEFLRIGALLFYFGFKMSFPFLLTLFITNLVLALINRLIPQINVFIVGLPLQLFVGIFFLLVGTDVIVHFLRTLAERFTEEILNAIKILGG
jgi:flagellar biosynthetic protein FliR